MMGVSSGLELLTLPHGHQLRLDLLERYMHALFFLLSPFYPSLPHYFIIHLLISGLLLVLPLHRLSSLSSSVLIF